MNINYKKNIINVAFVIIMALFQFPLRFAGYSYITFIVIYLIPLLYLTYNISWTICFLKRILNSLSGIAIIIFGIIFLNSIIWPIIHGTFEFSFVTEYWRRFFLLLIKNVFLVAIYEKYFSKDDLHVKEYLTYYIYAVILYIMFSGVTLVCKPLRNVLIQVLYLTEKNKMDICDPSYITRFGWSGWSGFDATMLCSLGICFCCIIILMFKNNYRKKNAYLINILILLIGNMFYGRTGLVVSLICVCLLCTIELIKGHIKFLFPIVCTGILGIVFLVILKERVPRINVWFNWAFSAFYNFITTGRFRDSTGSVGVLLDRMYWMPKWETLLLGDGYYNYNGMYYMQTDSGIMRLILYYGLINYALGWFAALIILYEFIKCINSNIRLSKKNNIYIFLALLIFMALFEIKGETYYKIVCILLPAIYLKRRKKYGLSIG